MSPRPRKRRWLARLPRTATYKPAGVPLNDLTRVLLLAEELEALRLADLEGLTQAEAAEQMGVSRSTFQRILARARQQVSLALVEGKALQIEPGPVDPDNSPRRGPRSRSARKRAANAAEDSGVAAESGAAADNSSADDGAVAGGDETLVDSA
jgi:predicted DNA-binding protein (UPF0251 family)